MGDNVRRRKALFASPVNLISVDLGILMTNRRSFEISVHQV
jgi:hypothetical protein